MLTFSNLLGDLVIARRQVVGTPAGHEALVHHYLLVPPVGAGVQQVGLQGV